MTPVLALAQANIDGLRPGSGNNWTGCCPLHGEVPGKSTPSFSFNIATGQWYCFAGCGGGSLRTFLKELGKSRDSIDNTMERLDRHLIKVERKKSPLRKKGMFLADYPLPERILGLFEGCPEELLEEGFDEDVLWSHDVGVDEERNRVTYPIRDIEGTLAGIVGRCHGEQQKYKVYRQELQDMGFSRYTFENHDYVWRWDVVYAQCFHSKTRPTVYVAEGFKACMWMVQNGYENTVALMGSSLSATQKVFLERLGGTVFWCFDNDRAGRAGIRKASYIIRGCRQLVINYPRPHVRESPDDLEPLELHEAIESGLSLPKWRRRYKQNE